MEKKALPVRSDTVRDPVCGMHVRPDQAAATHEHGGRTYYFCATVCRDRFRADPEWYLSLAAPPGARVFAGRLARWLYP